MVKDYNEPITWDCERTERKTMPDLWQEVLMSKFTERLAREWVTAARDGELWTQLFSLYC